MLVLEMRVFRRLRFFKRPRAFIPIIVILLLVTVVVMSFRNMNSPAEGTVTTASQTDNPSQSSAPTGDKHFADGFMNFNYSYKYSPETVQKQSGYLDAVRLASSSPRDKFINIGAYVGSLKNDSGVYYRQTHPDIYKTVSSGQGQVIFEKADNTEYTGFIQKGAHLITISLTTNSAADFSDDYQTIAGSLAIR